MLLLVPTSPRRVTVLSADVTSVLLSWQPPSPAHGVVTGYVIGYSSSRDGASSTNEDDRTTVVVGQPSARQYNVIGLLPYSAYQLQVLITYLQVSTSKDARVTGRLVYLCNSMFCVFLHYLCFQQMGEKCYVFGLSVHFVSRAVCSWNRTLGNRVWATFAFYFPFLRIHLFLFPG